MDSKKANIKAKTKNAKRSAARGFAADGAPVPPVAVSRMDKETRNAWNKILKALPAGVVSQLDSFAIYALCRSWSVWRFWEEQSTAADPAEAYKASCMAASSLKTLLSLFAKFGMTPKDRAACGTNPDQQPGRDPFSRFIDNLSDLSKN